MTQDIIGGMICLDVHLNGAKLCRAGVGKYGLVHVNAAWSYLPPAWRPNGQGRRVPGFPLGVSGVRYAPRPPDHENLHWHTGALSLGDDLRVQCIEAPTADEPFARDRSEVSPDEDQMEMIRSRLAGCAQELTRLEGNEAKVMGRELRALLKRVSK